jgi:hypothetical protein
MIDDCEECGAEATRTVHGICLCDLCDFGGEPPEETPRWATEIPSGLLNDSDDTFEEIDAAVA